MNYYNPYFYTIPNTIATPKIGLLTKLFGKSGISIGNILNGTQRVLNFANQAIPLVQQVRPIIGNAKTMFKVMNEFKKNEIPKQKIVANNEISNNNNNNNNNNIIQDNIQQNKQPDLLDNYSGPTFFI